MQTLDRKKVLLAVSGGIAAYKAVEVLRRLQDRGAEVRVMMTEAARRFVQPLTFEALSHHRVYTELFPQEGDPDVIHVGLAGWPDAVVLAPATAHTLGKAALGLADDLVSATLLACPKPILAAPAMESQMYQRDSVQANLDALRQSGYTFVGPERGPLASGASGVGRMAEPEAIVAALERMLAPRGPLATRTLVVTAGRTEEDIDPVRFITNRSTGKMGYAVAERALSRGAQVVLVTGPSALDPPEGAVVVRVRTVAEMEAATRKAFAASDALVMTAAVLDFRPESVSGSKIKKQAGPLSLRFVPTHDFLVDLGREKGDRIVIGFAMETQDPEAGALGKLRAKHLDLIVLNDLTVEGAGFAVDTNVVTLFDRFGTRTDLPKMTKAEVAGRVLDWIEGRWSAA